VFLAGEGALAFARAQRLELEDDDYFRVAPASGHRSGTVGAVALDVHGDLAAATSTGGMTGKLPGRIGDSSVVGAGTYARNDACAVSCTGHGEFFIRATAARDVAAQFERGATLEAALAAVLDGRVGALGGNGGAMIGSCATWNVVWYRLGGHTRGSGGSRERLGSLLPLLPPVTRRRHAITLQSRTSRTGS
jgi:beta-aspartyl-peptidase (threonine type)